VNVVIKKVDAMKGLKFTKFPYLLTLQLKRFEFDLTDMRRIKLDDRVTFPLELDMDLFLGDKKTEVDCQEPMAKMELDSDSDKGEKGNEMDISEESTETQDDDEEKSGEKDESKTKKRKKIKDEKEKSVFNLRVSKSKASNPYKLYSILIHRGSSMAGHYYAYIRCFENDKWYSFNDTEVIEIDDHDIEKVFGEDANTSWQHRSGANAYMLMYRKVDRVKNFNGCS